MPTFDYRCNHCGRTYDVFHKVREIAEDVVCPSCGSPEHTRLLSAPNVSTRMKVGASSCEAPACSSDAGGCCGGPCGLN